MSKVKNNEINETSYHMLLLRLFIGHTHSGVQLSLQLVDELLNEVIFHFESDDDDDHNPECSD